MAEIHKYLREIHQVGKRTQEWLIHPQWSRALQRHRIELAGISHATTGFRFSRPLPLEGQILVCLRGEGRAWIDGGWRKCTAGRAYLTPPGCFHAYEAGRRWEVAWIRYRAGASLPWSAVPRLAECDPGPFEWVVRGLHREISGEREPGRMEWWAHLLHGYARQLISPGYSVRLWRLWQAVQAEPGAAWTLEKLARLAALGPEQLRRICRRETGRSPMQQVTHLRMQYALSLVTTGCGIEEVAHLVGYENAFAFSTAFRRHLGHPPSQWSRPG
jgi:AraC-like DNA-binding protein